MPSYDFYYSNHQSLIERLEQVNPANVARIGYLAEEFEILHGQWRRERILTNNPILSDMDMRALLALCAKSVVMMSHAAVMIMRG